MWKKSDGSFQQEADKSMIDTANPEFVENRKDAIRAEGIRERADELKRILDKRSLEADRHDYPDLRISRANLNPTDEEKRADYMNLEDDSE